MIFLYRFLFPFALLAALPYYGWRMLRRGGYSRDFIHRFGGHKPLPQKSAGKRRIWIQAVSVGEVEAIGPLLSKLAANPSLEIIVTTTTSTGYRILTEKYAGLCLYVGVFPIDFYPFSKRTWDNFNPDIAVLMEGEMWPEHMHQASVRRAELYLINARMSDKSFARYSKGLWLSERILKKFKRVAASSEFDMARMIKLGVPSGRIFCSGNLKFDVKPGLNLSSEGKAALRREMGFAEKSLVLLGSSTWPGEEEMLIEAMSKIRARGIDCRLLLVPRHAERREKIKKLLECFPHHVRSQSKQASDGTLIYLADTTGELGVLTQIADMAFIGKSLPPNNGGQTPIECAALGVAMVYGPNMSNFRRVCKTLEREQACFRVENAKQAVEELVRLAGLPDIRSETAYRAKKWHDSNIGATDKVVQMLTGN